MLELGWTRGFWLCIRTFFLLGFVGEIAVVYLTLYLVLFFTFSSETWS